MKILCPVCGRTGILQVRGSSQRVGHYAGYDSGTSLIEWHPLVKTDGKDGKESLVKNKVDLASICTNKSVSVDRAGFEPATSALRSRN